MDENTVIVDASTHAEEIEQAIRVYRGLYK